MINRIDKPLPRNARKRMREKKKQIVAKARICPSTFIEYAFPNEKTGKKIINADFHKEWQKFFTDNRWCVLVSPIEHGKTLQTGLGRVIWEIGNNPNIRVLLVGESQPAARKLLRNIRKHIDRNKKVQQVFPYLRRSSNPEDPWNESDIVVERDSMSRDPTVQARGVGSENILGSRLDLIVLDDILNLENTATKHARDKTEEWFDTTCFTRIQDYYDEHGNLVDSGRVYVIGTPWNKDDFLHRLKRRKLWAYKHYSAVLNPKSSAKSWKPLWAPVWPLQRLLDRRDGTTQTTFSRKYLCIIMTDQMRRFKDAWIRHMLDQGVGRTFLDRCPRGRGGRKMRCITGVDLGVGKSSKDAKTVLFTIAIDDRTKRRIVVDIESGHWDGPTIVSKIEKKNWRYDSYVVVESNAAQKFIAQFSSNRAIPTWAFNTGKQNKYDEEFGVESIAVEMRAGMWIAPSGKDMGNIDPEIEEWIEDMEDYDPEMHTGDHLMSCWFAREGARKLSKDRTKRSDHMRR